MRLLLLRRGCSTGAWRTLPDGLTRWRQLETAGSFADGTDVQEGQTVRVDYVVRGDGDDGTLFESQASYRAGGGSHTVCACLDVGVVGMRLGDTRRLRVPPHGRRGHAVEAAGLPTDGFLEYDAKLTGVVQHMRIRTLEEEERPTAMDDPLRALVDAGKRAYDAVVGDGRKK